MTNLKIWKVTFNDGGWHSGSLPSFMIISESKKDAISKVLEENSIYKKGYDVWATELKFDGYIIEIYDEITYNRNKKLNELI